MTDQELIQWAAEEGFDAAAVIDTSEIIFDPTFRVYCQENLCGQYNANYSCPPTCGSPEEMKNRVLAHRKALVLQSVWNISDYTDTAAIKNAKGTHNRCSIALMKRLRAQDCSVFMAGASGCGLCRPCAMKKGEPCKFPDLRYSCLSAYCIYVKKLADSCNMAYDSGPGRLSFFGMLVYD